MRTEEKVLFLTARQDFLNSHKESITELMRTGRIDWERLYNLAVQHGIAPLVYLNLIVKMDAEIQIPDDLKEKFKRYTLHQTVEQNEKNNQLESALKFFQEHALDVMLFKGVALSLMVYTNPWMTVSNDIDLIIHKQRNEIPAEALIAIQDHFSFGGFEYDFYSHHDANMNGVLAVDFDRVWNDARVLRFRSYDIFVMSPEDFLFSLCVNSCRKRFFRLKSLCDIAETIYKFPEIRWDDFIWKAKYYESSNIVYAALQVVSRTVGCQLPDSVIDRLGLKSLKKAAIDRAINYLMNSLNLLPYPFTGKQLFGRQLEKSLILPYATYTGKQLTRKFREIIQFGGANDQ